MEDFILKKTEETPAIILMPSTGKFQIVGYSWPDNAEKFYKQIFDWFEQYFNNQPLDKTVFEIRLTYFNTSSAKQLTKLLLYLRDMSDRYNVKIAWYYNTEDEDMKEEAERYKTLLNLDDILEIHESDIIPTE